MSQASTMSPVSFTDSIVLDNAEQLCIMLAEGMGASDEACFQYPFADQVAPIESVSRDGFWAWTSGGFHVCLAASLSHHNGTGMAPAPIQPLLDQGDKFLADEWALKYPDRPSLIACICEDGIDDTWRNEAEEFEQEGWRADDDCYFYKARVMFLSADDRNNETGEDEVYIDCYLNTDLNYGRDNIAWLSHYGSSPNQTVGDFKRTMSLSDFAAMTPKELEALADEAIKQLP